MIVMPAGAFRVEGGTGSIGEMVGEGVTDRVIDSVTENESDAEAETGVAVVAVVEIGVNMTSVGSTDGTGVSVAASPWRGVEARVGRGVRMICP